MAEQKLLCRRSIYVGYPRFQHLIRRKLQLEDGKALLVQMSCYFQAEDRLRRKQQARQEARLIRIRELEKQQRDVSAFRSPFI